MEWNRITLAEIIYANLELHKEELTHFYSQSGTIKHFFLDNLLPDEVVHQIFSVFPKPSEMVLKKSWREDKYVAAQLNQYHPLLEEITYAFQEERIVKTIASICGINNPFADENLYAGGLSLMGYKQFLNPHLDNSHDKDRNRWRVLNLLYYVSPDWQLSYGGNLELWPDGLSKSPITIHSKFNRLAVMETHNKSLHSVSPVTFEGNRCCISNYYFSDQPLHPDDSFHVTSFRARPENKYLDVLLRLDTFLRMGVRKIFKKGVKENPHVYKKSDSDK